MVEIKFRTGNAAFHDEFNPEYDRDCMVREIERILRDVIEKLDCGYTEGKCIDYNGNAVGEWKLDA